MAEHNRNGQDSVEERIAQVMQIIETLEYPELKRVHDLIAEEYKTKSETAKVRVIAEARANLEQLGLSFEDAAALTKKRKRRNSRTPALPKYRSPDGVNTWSGRGATPKWIREHEEAGGKREEYLIAQ